MGSGCSESLGLGSPLSECASSSGASANRKLSPPQTTRPAQVPVCAYSARRRAMRCPSLQSRQTEDFVQRRGNAFQLIALVRIMPDFRRDESVVADLDQRSHNCFPVHIAFHQIDLAGGLRSGREFHVLEVNALNALAESQNPVLGISIRHAVAGIELGSHPWAGKLIDEGAHFEWAQEELVRNVFGIQINLRALRFADHFLQLGGITVPSILRADIESRAVSQ